MKKVFSTFILISCVLCVFSTAAFYLSNLPESSGKLLLNDTPDAVNDYYTINEDVVLNDFVNLNDTLSTDSTNTWSVVTAPAHGVIVLDTNGHFQYTPNLNYSGADTIAYQMCDIDGDCDTAFIYIVINAVNDMPVTVNDTTTTVEDNAVNIDVATNDSDIDGNVVATSVTVPVQPAHGTATVDNLTGIITYTPNLNFWGTETFAYSICDDGTPLPSACNTGYVVVNVTPVNDAGLPVTNNDYAYTPSYSPVTINVLYNDNFGDVPCTCAISATNGAHGTTSINTNGTPTNPVDDKVVYTPNTSYHGPDSFTYTITDIDGETSTATVYMDVTSMFAPTLTAPVNNATSQMPNAFLVWTAVPSAFSYKAQVSTDSLFTTTKDYYTTLTATNADHLNFNTTYYWRVKAYGVSESDSCGWSEIKKFKVIKTVTITAPVNNAQNRAVSMLFKWNAITGISNYEYQIDSSLSFTSPLFVRSSVASNKTEVYSKNIAFNTNYHLRMRAMHATDTSDWSAVLNFRTIDTVNLRNPGNDSVNFSPIVQFEWDWLGSKHYEYLLATDSLFTTAVSKIIDTNHVIVIATAPYDTLVREFSDTLRFGQKYFWKVRGVNSFGTSQWSAEWNFTTVDKVTLVAPADGGVNVSTLPVFVWKKIDNIGFYNMELDTSSSFTNPVYKTFSSSLASDTIYTELKPYTTYYWRMRAATSVDSTDWSAPYHFTTASPYGITDNLANGNINIYPNPSITGKVNIQIPAINSQKINLTVVNMVGQEIYSEALQLKSGNNLFTINLQNNENGIYFIRLQSDDYTLSRKIILNR
ncbi:MAG TPA: Ig-like domain-containing protein [Bacteroidales bacterium]|nr:Ig-like domain-containing protein [Bacteroidales bacterium]